MQHAKRWITAIVLIPLILWILFKGSPLLLAALVSVVSVFAIQEYLKIIFGTDNGPISRTIRAISHGISVALILGAMYGSWPGLVLILALNLVLLAIFVMFRFTIHAKIFDMISKQVLGMIYIPLSLSLLMFLRETDGGIWWILWLLIVSFANDTGAFYAGTYFGKHKLHPQISPNKTKEGSAGGILASMVAGFLFCLIFFDFFTAAKMLPCAFLMAVAGQIGDLFESAMKRVSSIKDSGRILPGHGGMLDRIDGLLLAIPVLYGYLVVV